MTLRYSPFVGIPSLSVPIACVPVRADFLYFLCDFFRPVLAIFYHLEMMIIVIASSTKAPSIVDSSYAFCACVNVYDWPHLN